MAANITKLSIDKSNHSIIISANAEGNAGGIANIYLDNQDSFVCVNEPSTSAAKIPVDKLYSFDLYDNRNNLIDTGKLYLEKPTDDGTGRIYLYYGDDENHDIREGSYFIDSALGLEEDREYYIDSTHYIKITEKNHVGTVYCDEEGNPIILEDYSINLSNILSGIASIIDLSNDMIFVMIESPESTFVAGVIFDQNALYQLVFKKIHNDIKKTKCCNIPQDAVNWALLFEAFQLSWSTADSRKFIEYWNKLHQVQNINNNTCRCND